MIALLLNCRYSPGWLVTPSANVKTLAGKIAVEAGPLVYAIESTDDNTIGNASLPADVQLQPDQKINSLAGMQAINIKSTKNKLLYTAIPFFTLGNRGKSAYKVWFNFATAKELYGSR